MPLLHVEYLYVHPCMRGKGWGAALMGAVCGWADKVGLDLQLYVCGYGTKSLSNTSLIKFYKTGGFVFAPGNAATWILTPTMVRRHGKKT